MNSRDIELVRLFTTETGGIVADLTFPVGAPFEVVVDAEAGSWFILPSVPTATFAIGVTVRDLTDGTSIPTTPIAPTPAPSFPISNPTPFGAVNWPAAKHQFRYTVAAADIATRANHVCEAVAVLTVTPTVAPFDPDVSTVTSPRFVITP